MKRGKVGEVARSRLVRSFNEWNFFLVFIPTYLIEMDVKSYRFNKSRIDQNLLCKRDRIELKQLNWGNRINSNIGW